MGLMLSILIVCVGVIEALSCFEHFQYGVLHCATNVYEHARRRSSVFLSYTSRKLKLLSDNSITEEEADDKFLEPIKFNHETVNGFDRYNQYSESVDFKKETKPVKKLEKEEKIQIVKSLLEKPRRPKTVRSISMPELVHTERDIELTRIINDLIIEPIEEINIEIEDENPEALTKEFDKLFNEYESVEDNSNIQECPPDENSNIQESLQEENFNIQETTPEENFRGNVGVNFEEEKLEEPEKVFYSNKIVQVESKSDVEVRDLQKTSPKKENPIVEIARINISQRVNDKGADYFKEALNKRSLRLDRSISVDFGKVTSISKPTSGDVFSKMRNDSDVVNESILEEPIPHNKLDEIIFESDTPPVEVIDKTFEEIFENICDEPSDLTSSFDEIESIIMGDIESVEPPVIPVSQLKPTPPDFDIFEDVEKIDTEEQKKEAPTDQFKPISLNESSSLETISNTTFIKAVEQLAEILSREAVNLSKIKSLILENLNREENVYSDIKPEMISQPSRTWKANTQKHDLKNEIFFSALKRPDISQDASINECLENEESKTFLELEKKMGIEMRQPVVEEFQKVVSPVFEGECSDETFSPGPVKLLDVQPAAENLTLEHFSNETPKDMTPEIIKDVGIEVSRSKKESKDGLNENIEFSESTNTPKLFEKLKEHPASECSVTDSGILKENVQILQSKADPILAIEYKTDIDPEEKKKKQGIAVNEEVQKVFELDNKPSCITESNEPEVLGEDIYAFKQQKDAEKLQQEKHEPTTLKEETDSNIDDILVDKSLLVPVLAIEYRKEEPSKDNKKCEDGHCGGIQVMEVIDVNERKTECNQAYVAANIGNLPQEKHFPVESEKLQETVPNEPPQPNSITGAVSEITLTVALEHELPPTQENEKREKLEENKKEIEKDHNKSTQTIMEIESKNNTSTCSSIPEKLPEKVLEKCSQIDSGVALEEPLVIQPKPEPFLAQEKKTSHENKKCENGHCEGIQERIGQVMDKNQAEGKTVSIDIKEKPQQEKQKNVTSVPLQPDIIALENIQPDQPKPDSLPGPKLSEEENSEENKNELAIEEVVRDINATNKTSQTPGIIEPTNPDEPILKFHEKITEEKVNFERLSSVDSTFPQTKELEKSVSTEHSNESKTENSEATTSAPEAFWLIFSGEYTKAMSKDWHSGHFSCWQCDEALTGQRYVLRDDHPYCIKCYESVFANVCEECNKIIGIDSKDLSYKDKHWHEACFLCNKCRVSLVDKQFGSKADKIYCGNCYDAQFASRCDGCGEIFRAGTKKMEYKTRQWHEKCFCCCVCKTPIGTKSFIPREQEIYCATCYEEKFATRCVKCNKIITSGGVTYKNEPWHRECFTCTNCNTSLAGQRFTSRDEKPYCADCFGELFAKRCTACSRPITGIGGTRFISFEDRHWHNDCFICASCKTSLVGRGFITDGDDIICPECAKQKLM